MTSFKFLVICCGMLAAAGCLAPAATTNDPDNTAEVTGAPGTDVPKTTHHKRHHKTATTDSASTNTPAAAGTTTPESKKAKTASSDQTVEDKAAADASNNATATTSSTTVASHKHRKKHPAETDTASSEKTLSKKKAKPAESENAAATAKPSAPATPAPTAPAATSIGAAAAASSVINSQTAVATQGKGHRHRHGRTVTATPLPEPPIVITTVNVPPLSSGPSTVPPLGMPPASNSIVPTVETGLPVPRPGAGTTATLPIAMIRSPNAPPVDTHFTFNDYNEHKTRTYPWKSGIVTTVFWIGEGSTPLSGMTNKMSAWDMNWVHDNGGADDQYDMNGYASGSHASLINPFYVALPFNDLAYPDKTARWLPSGWYKQTHHGDKPVSACQGRWIEIKNRAGRTCFAQWEDVGPINTDDAEYVFGQSRPSASRGLDVSPAVAKYLGIDSTAITSWRFVDDDDVQPGMWLRYNEQAILFQALKDQSHRSTPIQDLSQPVPDGSDDSDSQKQIRAGRG